MASLAAYWQFQEAVAHAQLRAWLPDDQRLLIDISGDSGVTARLAARAGHLVLRVVPRAEGPPPGDGIHLVVADLPALGCLADGSADGVIAEGRTLSFTLAAETLVGEISRVLRPTGRVLACVDSLVLGMAVLAAHQHWAELADLPHADVVLIPWPDGTITRCYGVEQLRELFADSGLVICWIRPRTVLTARTVDHLMSRPHASLPRLVAAELRARPDDSLGTQLVISARKPAAGRRPATKPSGGR